jgi:hypothetical protein
MARVGLEPTKQINAPDLQSSLITTLAPQKKFKNVYALDDRDELMHVFLKQLKKIVHDI